MSRRPIGVSFVCLGNICRSPTAEGVMKRLVVQAGLTDWIEVESAGTAAYHVGERPDERARAAARGRGIQLTSRARHFRPRDFDRLDYILAMDRENLSNLQAIQPRQSFTGHLGLLRNHDPLAPPNAEVPDPYYGGDAGFEEVLDLCEAACLGLLERIRTERGTP